MLVVIHIVNMKTLTILFLTTAIWAAHSAKILGIYPLPGHSHYMIGRSLLRALSEKGHDVTMISTFGEKDPPKNGTYRDILLKDLLGDAATARKKKPNNFERLDLNPFIGAYVVSKMGINFVEMALNHSKVQNLLHSDETFDVIILDNFLSDAFKAFATRFNAPLVLVTPVWQNFLVNPLVANPSPPSYVPNVLSEYYHPMTFCERLTNTLLDVFNYIIYQNIVFPQHNELVKKYIPRGGDLQDIMWNTSLVLLNSHPSLNQALPRVPNMIEVGGLHVQPTEKLPKDLQDFLDSAKEGVVYFSMGSNLQGTKLAEDKRAEIIKAFSKLKYKVLWKWEDDELPGKPDNVYIRKWVPQPDVLAHPNVKLFITHGGFMSSIEATAGAVPVLVLPIYGDQYQNAHFAASNGYGRFLKFHDINENTLLTNINGIINDPLYKQRTQKRKELFFDRLASPLDTAVYWVEYVIKHKGAPHLKVAGSQLSWYTYYLIDVIAFIVLVIAGWLALTCFIVKKLCGKKVNAKKNKKD